MRVTRNSSRNDARESTGRQPAPIAHASGGRPHRYQRENAAGRPADGTRLASSPCRFPRTGDTRVRFYAHHA